MKSLNITTNDNKLITLEVSDCFATASKELTQEEVKELINELQHNLWEIIARSTVDEK